jgi:hypothetical protein
MLLDLSNASSREVIASLILPENVVPLYVVRVRIRLFGPGVRYIPQSLV